MIEYATEVTVVVRATCPKCKKSLDARKTTSLPMFRAGAARELRASLERTLAERGWTIICGTCRDSSVTDKASCT
jgi:hypothetical protein